MQNEPELIQSTLSGIAETVFDYPGGSMADRCKVIHVAYQAHVINLKDMTYALMQYYIAEIASGDMHNSHPLPPNPVKPEKGASVEVLDKYYRDHASYRRASNQNYEATEMMKRVDNFQLVLREAEKRVKEGKALEGDDYDYRTAREWGAYIVTGVVSGAVKAYLGSEPAPAAQTEVDNEEYIPL